MADTKKQPASERVATPKASSSSNDHLKTLSAAIGARVRLTTASATHEGTLFTACPIFNVVAINTAPAPPNPTSTAPGDYQIIPLSRITNVSILSLPGTTSFAAALPALGKVDTARLKEREEARIRKLHAEEEKKGKGVSAEAQALFDALDRMYPARWNETDIIVDDSVIISAPYGPENARAPKGKEQVLAYIKRIVEGERKKFASRGGSPMPRKGG